jgi:hypothetical protein
MKQMISVYRKKDAYLLHPNSQVGERGVWLAQQPGIGLSCGADDSVLGALVLFLAPHSTQGLPSQDLRAGAPFPLSSIAGVASWGSLTRASPIMVHVLVGTDGIKIEPHPKDGGGYGPVVGEVHVLPSTAMPNQIGEAIRMALS